MYVWVEGADGLTCVSISALIVDAHRILAGQEPHHVQVFTVGARADNIMCGKSLPLHRASLVLWWKHVGQYLWNAVSLKMFSLDRLSAPDS